MLFGNGLWCEFYHGRYLILHCLLLAGMQSFASVTIAFLMSYYHFKCQNLNMLSVTRDIKQQDLKIIHINFVKSE